MKRNLREKILREASKLFSEFGFSGTSMRDIAKSLNITKAALYYHFQSKKELYSEVLDRAFQKLAKNLNKELKARSFEQALFQLIKNYLEWGIEEKNLIKAQIAKFPELDPEIRKNILKLRGKVRNRFEEVFRKVLKKEMDPKFFVSFLLGTMDRMILEAAFLGKKLNIKKKTLQILKVLNPFIKVASK